MGWLTEWNRRRILAGNPVDEQTWRQASEGLSILNGLTETERRRLQEFAILFLSDKSMECAGGLHLTHPQRLRIALLACLPVLNLGLDWYDGWHAVIVYPDEFVTDHEEMDEAGVVHRIHEPRSGESWQHGPMIVTWAPIENPDLYPDHNLVIHECAHKLDTLNGAANGFPPLHRGMSAKEWADVFGEAFGDFQKRVDEDQETLIDPYGAEAPEEFFAVVSEVFFAAPWILKEEYPQVYEQLVLFYRQDPARRIAE